MVNLIECDVCDYQGADVFKHDGMMMCPACKSKEIQLSKEIADTADERVEQMNERMNERPNIDTSIQISSDLFNAKTIAIVEMKAQIQQDNSIENKEFELASRLKDRFTHLKQIIFDIEKTKMEATSEQRSIQQYLNELANQLRTEERESLRLQDINYKPIKPKSIKEPKKRTPKKAKFDKIELRRVASELGIPEFTLQMTCVSKGCTPSEAGEFIKQLTTK